ncbi:insulinase family protein [Echinicola strongylocentroti]|uniref:Insulinase family protein n=1 Tax=Echinicola strongylocentroti TaxID=1795355 RepID=A0A2Z4IL65_9BACT|nr:insulinase family protein [Echinicola strongylocentroti]AWW31308.1 insulinase family protein [Echinicola strongylocentroti]
MKKSIIYLILCMAVTSLSHAQVDRSKYPEPGPAPEIELGDPETFTLDNGLKVFVVENHKLPRVAFSLVIDRDPIVEKEKAGMTGFVGDILMAGTTSRSKDQLDEEVDFIGASLSAGSTSLYGSSLKEHQEKILTLMEDVLFHPSFPQEELDKLKKQALTGLAASKDEPDAISGRLAGKLVYGTDHPYGEIRTEESISAIEMEDIRAYYETYFKPNIAYLAIVGDIDKKEAEKVVKAHFAKWKKGDVPEMSYSTPSVPEQNEVALVDRSASVQSVVDITYPMEMSLGNNDYLDTRVLNYILGGGASSRLFMNLREDKGYTYGAYSSIGADELVTSFSAGASVRTAVTDSAVTELIYEINRIMDEGITEEELEAAKANLSGSFGRSLESPSTLARFAINIERYDLPADFYKTYLQRLSALTVDDINAAARKYIKPSNMYITVVGNGSEIKDNLAQFGPVSLYNNWGDPVKEIEMTDMDMTAEDVIDNYIKAIGGEDAVNAVETAKVMMKAEVQGQVIGMTMVYDDPAMRFSQKVSMMGNTVSNTLLSEGKGTVSAMGQSKELTDEQYEEAKMNMFIFPEAHYEDLMYTLELDGIKDIDGQKAYKVIVSNPTGAKSVNYYSVETGLKVKSENEKTGEITYSDYQEHEGIQYAMEMIVKSPMIPAPLNTTVESLELNPELTEEDFK